MTTVVLGWDGLDYELATEWGVADLFGRHHREIATFDNEVLEKPHTYELWPSIITGQRPDEHGITAAGDSGAQDWENPLIHRTAQIAQHVIPERVRTQIGEILRSRGAKTNQKGPDYYTERGVSTVFDDRRALPLAIPNYHTQGDERYGVLADRGAQLAQVLEWDSSGENGRWHEPGIPESEFDELLAGEAHKKLGIVREAIHRDYDLIFVWLGYLDSVGHVAPVVEEAGYQARSYRQAARWTREIQGELADDDTLVSVSDHGLRDGYHTHQAFLGSSDPQVIELAESVLDVRAAVDAVTPTRSTVRHTESVPVREEYRQGANTTERSTADVRQQLDDLGYL